MITERTHYFAKPGLAEAVLAIRRQANAVRRELGLASGRIYTRGAADGTGVPDVIWECDFPDEAAQAADLSARARSEAFAAIRAEMTRHLSRFERHVMRRDTERLANGMGPVDLTDVPIVPRKVTFPSAGRDLVGYLFLPPGEGPFPLMITNHGSGIDKGTFDVSRPGGAALLMSWGIASFLPHRRGYGDSPGAAWREEVTAEFGTEDYDRQLVARLDAESDDVIAALAAVADLPEVMADHIGVMGSSFGGTNTLFAAAKCARFTCAIDFAGAAMNWDRTPALRAHMTAALGRVRMPIFLIQAANDYSVRPTRELPASVSDRQRVVWSKIYPAFGINPMEGHLFESRGATLWAADVHRFLERFL